jgi:hypothetical protein
MLEESRIRAVAVIHALIGLAFIVGAVVWVYLARNSRSLGAAGIPLLAGVEILVAATFLAICYLLWSYHPLGKWITALLLVGALVLALCGFANYAHLALSEAANWRRGAKSDFLLDLRFALFWILTTAWGALALVALFRPGSSEVFSIGYKESNRADARPVPFYASPYFVAGVVIGVINLWAMSVTI